MLNLVTALYGCPREIESVVARPGLVGEGLDLHLAKRGPAAMARWMSKEG